MVSIRPALLPDDADAIVSLYMETASYHADLAPERYTVPQAEDLRRQLLSAEASGASLFLALAEDDEGKTVGVVVASVSAAPDEGLMRTRGPLLGISDIVVTKTCRGRGYGRQLLQAAEAWGREQGAREASLGVDPLNQSALRFYDQAGFHSVRQELRKPLVPD